MNKKFDATGLNLCYVAKGLRLLSKQQPRIAEPLLKRAEFYEAEAERLAGEDAKAEIETLAHYSNKLPALADMAREILLRGHSKAEKFWQNSKPEQPEQITQVIEHLLPDAYKKPQLTAQQMVLQFVEKLPLPTPDNP